MQDEISKHIEEIVNLIPLSENVTAANNKARLQIIMDLYDWQIKLQDYLKNPCFKNTENKVQNNVQINKKGINLINT